MTKKAMVLCECSGVMVKALEAVGFEAFSVDLKPAESSDFLHFQGDALEYLERPLDLMVAMPECRYLCLSGVGWLYNTPENPKPGTLYGVERWKAMHEAARFFKAILNAKGPRYVALENSEMHPYALDIIAEPHDFCVQAWHHGAPEKKGAYIWTRGKIPTLNPTNITPKHKRLDTCNNMAPSATRSADRARTNPVIAKALAEHFAKHVK